MGWNHQPVIIRKGSRIFFLFPISSNCLENLHFEKRLNISQVGRWAGSVSRTSFLELGYHQEAVVLLMEEILHHQQCMYKTMWMMGYLPYNWCRISSINSSSSSCCCCCCCCCCCARTDALTARTGKFSFPTVTGRGSIPICLVI